MAQERLHLSRGWTWIIDPSVLSEGIVRLRQSHSAVESPKGLLELPKADLPWFAHYLTIGEEWAPARVLPGGTALYMEPVPRPELWLKQYSITAARGRSDIDLSVEPIGEMVLYAEDVRIVRDWLRDWSDELRLSTSAATPQWKVPARAGAATNTDSPRNLLPAELPVRHTADIEGDADDEDENEDEEEPANRAIPTPPSIVDAPRSSSREAQPPIDLKAAVGTSVVLVIAPILADADLIGSYWPWLLLRLWMVAFGLYGAAVANAREDWRRALRYPYLAIAAIFGLLWGLPIELWAVVDWTAAAFVLISSLLMRSRGREPS